MAFTLEQLAEVIDARIEGQSDCKITAINTLKDSGEGDISFLSNRRYSKYLANTGASAVILKDEDLADCPTNALIVDDPYIAYAKVANLIYVNNNLHFEISSTALIGSHCQVAGSVFIGANVVVGDHVEINNECYIGPGCVIGDNVSIKTGTRLSANITLCKGISIGQNVIIHPGVVIGADGFGIARDKEGWIKIPQIGSVIISDNVEIGANTTIDRGAIGDTVVEEGVKIDNQVQIGHNVHIGERSAIAGCTAIAGSTTIGKRCMNG